MDAVKALLIGGLLAAGVAVLGDVVGSWRAEKGRDLTSCGNSSSAAAAIFINCTFDQSY